MRQHHVTPSFLGCTLSIFLSLPLSAAPPEPVAYTLEFPAPHRHYVHVSATIPTDGKRQVDLFMAVWTPGSYLVREYAQHLEAFAAKNAAGKDLPVVKTAKNRWRVTAQGTKSIAVSYRLFARNRSVRGNWVEGDFALINGAPTFITRVDSLGRPHDVHVQLPSGWKQAVTNLPRKPEAGANHFRAADYDTLVDSPIVLGSPRSYDFFVGGVPHWLVNIGEGDVWDGPRSAADTSRIVAANLELWGSLPYKKYYFLNLIVERGGGLEHKESCVLMTRRWMTRTRKDYLSWLRLVSHEHFHAWNVKRLRPVELGPFEYEREVYTRSLWQAEGITTYYADVLLARAGIYKDESEYLESLSGMIRRLQNTPGRLQQSLEAASYDAWIKFYRPGENSPNATISYYLKGAVVSFLLDAKIRRATGGSRSLDDVLRLAYKRYSGQRGFRREEFKKTAGEIGGKAVQEWLGEVLEGTAELDYTQALDWYGLKFEEDTAPQRGPAGAPPPAWLGLVTQERSGRLFVGQLRRGTPAYESAFSVGDEILAIDEYRVAPGGWKERLVRYRPGTEASVLVARRGKLLRVPVRFGKQPKSQWKLVVKPKSTPQEKARRRSWLGF